MYLVLLLLHSVVGAVVQPCTGAREFIDSTSNRCYALGAAKLRGGVDTWNFCDTVFSYRPAVLWSFHSDEQIIWWVVNVHNSLPVEFPIEIWSGLRKDLDGQYYYFLDGTPYDHPFYSTGSYVAPEYGGYNWQGTNANGLWDDQPAFRFRTFGDPPKIRHADIFDGNWQYTGLPCCYYNFSKCYGFDALDYGNVCGGVGGCYNEDECRCDSVLNPPLFPDCTYQCFGVNHTDPDVCGAGNGHCVNTDTCSCEGPWCGVDCTSVCQCDGIDALNTSYVCSFGGDCESDGTTSVNGECNCWEGYYPPGICNETTCNLIPRSGDEDHLLCSGHGQCVGYDDCVCLPQWTNNFCDVKSTCGLYDFDDRQACMARGNCSARESGVCVCETGFSGLNCEGAACFGLESTDPSVCSSQGICYGSNRCWCSRRHYGRKCEEWIDDSTISVTRSVLDDFLEFSVAYVVDLSFLPSSEKSLEIFDCRQRMVVRADFDIANASMECQWFLSWSGETTASVNFTMKGISSLDLFAQSGHFELEFALLTSDNLYETVPVDVTFTVTHPPKALTTGAIVAIAVVAVVLPLLLLAVTAVSVLCIASRLKQQKEAIAYFGRLENFDILLQEQKAEISSGLAGIKVSKDCFVIPYDDVKLVKKLGAGGSGSMIYLASWKKRVVAFKVFKITDSTSTLFAQFETEIAIAISVRHPNILTIYGASVQLPRVGIVMEYCENGELKKYISMTQLDSSLRLTLPHKLRILTEISDGMGYLHSRSIIHRDLKAENVLLDASLRSRIIDFGVSKVVRDETIRMTRGVGTSVYMSPEVVMGELYDHRCDVFSWGILAWEVLHENFEPYGPSVSNVEARVAQDPSYRPIFRPEVREQLSEMGLDGVATVVERCWSHNPSARDEFDSIAALFRELRGQSKVLENEPVIEIASAIIKKDLLRQTVCQNAKKMDGAPHLQQRQTEPSGSGRSSELAETETETETEIETETEVVVGVQDDPEEIERLNAHIAELRTQFPETFTPDVLDLRSRIGLLAAARDVTWHRTAELEKQLTYYAWQYEVMCGAGAAAAEESEEVKLLGQEDDGS